MTLLLDSDLRRVTGGEQVKANVYGDPGSPGRCAWLDKAIEFRSRPHLIKALGKGVDELKAERERDCSWRNKPAAAAS